MFFQCVFSSMYASFFTSQYSVYQCLRLFVCVCVRVFLSFNIIKIISLVVDPFFRFFFHLNFYVIFLFCLFYVYLFRRFILIYKFLILMRFSSISLIFLSDNKTQIASFTIVLPSLLCL